MNREQKRANDRAARQAAAKGGVVLPPHDAPPTALFFAYVHGQFWSALWGQSVLTCAARSQQYGFMLRPRACESGPQIDKARNLLVKSFLETEDPYLLFSDTDIVFAPQDVKALLEADAPIAGALYFTAAAGMEPWPVALVEGDDKGSDDASRPTYVPVTLPEPPEDLDENDLADLQAWVEEAGKPMRVAAVGCGLMLIKREVVASMADYYEFPFEYADGRSEDLTFCLRAAALGYETMLVPAARVGHVKATVL